jgi:hypothetical protein
VTLVLDNCETLMISESDLILVQTTLWSSAERENASGLPIFSLGVVNSAICTMCVRMYQLLA